MAPRTRKQPSLLWLWFGFVGMALHLLYGLFVSFGAVSLGLWFAGWLGWLSASVPYFFVGALAGVLWSKRKLPEWALAFLVFWLLADIAAYALATPHSVWRIVLFLFFPIVFGSLFVPFAWKLLIPASAPWLLYVFDTVYLVIFASWLWLEHTARWKWVRRALLALLLLVLLVGAVSCAAQLTG